mmetsp:Transcript_6733/g.23501  ORF Transcript_6733/g.23501 Transcript_6733/m.23501 type:complete len:92 (+) Transcript_6733:2660-2935(+)
MGNIGDARCELPSLPATERPRGWPPATVTPQPLNPARPLVSVQVLPGLDPKPTNIVACSSFHADGSEVLPVLVRLEVDIRSVPRRKVHGGR